MNNKHALLVLNRLPNVGPRTIAKLLRRWPDAQTIFSLSRKDLRHAGVPERLTNALLSVKSDAIDVDLRWQEQHHQTLLTWFDEAYPALLKEIPDAPPVLYASGDISCLEGPKLAMVGTRTPSITGAEAAWQFARDLGEQGVTIVSGLARGVDGEAHRGCLSGNGQTVAVLGTGIDCIYPRQHAKLTEEIKAKGLILSEFPLGTPPAAGHFPRRNRIISGLSDATLVIECSLKSGTLITAHLALEQNRNVMALPGSIHNPEAKGCHALLRQGAALVTSTQEVLEELCIERSIERRFGVIGKDVRPPEGESGSLIAYIGFDVTTVDKIVDRSRLPVEDVINDLAELELLGHVNAVPGGYIRCKR
ncbi:MAG: DNA-processing protein DprA [Legionellaceae bacterium]|nr:DNA-processing protein DprA [Legionellaceae bacterium]